MSALHPIVLVVDKDLQILRYLRPALTMAGYGLETAASGALALKTLATRPPDALVLDLDLADMDGKDLLSQIRLGFDGPIVVLSARGREVDKIDAFDLGADDFVEKPFTIDEVLARLRVAFRRRIIASGVQPVIYAGAVCIDLVTRKATRANETLDLTEYQYAILARLASAGGKLLTYTSLLDGWSKTGGISTPSRLRVFIRQLREKIEDDPDAPMAITTERGLGYRLNVTRGSGASP